MSYVISVIVCLAYGLLCLWLFRRGRIELARRRRAYERQLIYEAMQKASVNIARLVPAYALSGEAAARASKSMHEFAEAWKFGEEMRERFQQ